MVRVSFKAVLAGMASLALAASAVGLCPCVLDAAECHREARQADAHACCEEPAGVQAMSEECCVDATPEPVVASQDVSRVTPPALQVAHTPSTDPSPRTAVVIAVRSLPPLPLDRTTVLLI
jgi:hypothetical protein